MDIREALDIVVARTGHERYRDLCDPESPTYNPKWVDRVIRKAQEPDDAPSSPRTASPPSPASMLAGDLVAALTARIGADRAAKFMAKILTGVPDCGCEARRIALNEIDRKLRRRLKLPGWLKLGSN